ncbi:hypothetical protein FVE85_8162 [Porphyridium purpureum]|uniref:Uncharacterized protein n=1 Tax=Porphyridium purpureum TaxID=35688 RepID=A0A5J4YN97_PORPP|nr:hypothetical protein FVE85_8162 [Porphyridium purpureum]|eukprot:POR0520..scf295_9
MAVWNLLISMVAGAALAVALAVIYLCAVSGDLKLALRRDASILLLRDLLNANTEGAKSALEQQAQQAAATGSTGRAFVVERVRAYEGPRGVKNGGYGFEKMTDQPQAYEFPRGRRRSKWLIVIEMEHPDVLLQQLDALCAGAWGILLALNAKDAARWRDQAQVSSERFRDVKLVDEVELDTLPFETLRGRKTMWNTNAAFRKNVAYLTSIWQGAQWILESHTGVHTMVGLIDDLLTAFHNSSAANFDGRCSSVAFDTESDSDRGSPRMTLVNPYRDLGLFLNTSVDASKWPLGYPLDAILRARPTLLRTDAESAHAECLENVAILHSLESGDADTDSFYQATVPAFKKASRLAQSQRVGLDLVKLGGAKSHKVMSVYGAIGSLHRVAVSAPLAFVPVSPMHSPDILRSFFAQRVLWMTPWRTAFSTPFMARNASSPVAVAMNDSEFDRHLRSSAILSALDRWACGHGTTIACMEQLYIDMYEHDVLRLEDVQVMRSFLFDLSRLLNDHPANTAVSLDSHTEHNRSAAQNDESVAICLSGTTRSLIRTAPSLLRNLILTIPAKYCVYPVPVPLGSAFFLDFSFGIIGTACEIVAAPDRDYAADMLHFKQEYSEYPWGACWRSTQANDSRCYKRALGDLNTFGPVTHGSSLAQTYGVHVCETVLKAHEAESSHQFDRVVLTRPDMFWGLPHAQLDGMDIQAVHIPEGTDFTGLNDRHFIFNREHFRAFAGIYPTMLAGQSTGRMVFGLMMPTSGCYNREKAVKNWLVQYLHIRVNRFVAYYAIACNPVLFEDASFTDLVRREFRKPQCTSDELRQAVHKRVWRDDPLWENAAVGPIRFRKWLEADRLAAVYMDRMK